MTANAGPHRPDGPGMDYSNLRREIQMFLDTHSLDSTSPYLLPIVAYAAMKPDTRERLLEWIAAMVAPASDIYPANSYSLKHDAEDAINHYIRNDELKGAMLACGYLPTPQTAGDVNWRFRIKSRVPPRQRAPAGQRGFAGLRVSPEAFGAILRQHRETKEVGLRQLAKIVGISPSYLSNIEHGKFPPPAEDKVIAMARELAVDPDALLADAGRVASDVVETVRQQPVEMAKLVRAAGQLKPEQIDEVATELEGRADAA